MATIAMAGCSSGPAVTPVSVRYYGPSGFEPLSPAAVEVRKEIETRPHEVIADLSVPTDGDTTYESLVQRLRERAAALGADAITHVTTVYETPAGGPSTNSSNTNLPEDAGREAAATGLSLLLHRPKWVAVRGIAVRLKERHTNERSFNVHDPKDQRISPVQDAQRVSVPKQATNQPAENKPVDPPR